MWNGKVRNPIVFQVIHRITTFDFFESENNEVKENGIVSVFVLEHFHEIIEYL
jgi:hypothetical protein